MHAFSHPRPSCSACLPPASFYQLAGPLQPLSASASRAKYLSPLRPSLLVGPALPSPTAAITNSYFRGEFPTVVAASSSTAPDLADDNQFPNLARLATSETNGPAFAAAAVAHYFGWTRIAVIADDSTWGMGASQAFQAAYKNINPQYSIINENDLSTINFDGNMVKQSPQ